MIKKEVLTIPKNVVHRTFRKFQTIKFLIPIFTTIIFFQDVPIFLLVLFEAFLVIARRSTGPDFDNIFEVPNIV